MKGVFYQYVIYIIEVIKMMAQVEEKYSDLFELVNQGYMYNKTAPRWVNGRGYFYLISDKNKINVKIQCSEEEYTELRKRIERKMKRIHGQLYYPRKGEKKEKKEHSPIEIADRIMNRNAELIEFHTAKQIEFIQELETRLGMFALFTGMNYANIPPSKIMEAVDTHDYNLILEPITKWMYMAFATYQNPEYVEKLERENQELKMEVERYKQELEEKNKIIEELNIQLSGVASILNEEQRLSYLNWIKMRLGMGWTPLNKEKKDAISQGIYYMPISYDYDAAKWNMFKETLILAKAAQEMLSQNNDNTYMLLSILSEVKDYMNHILTILKDMPVYTAPPVNNVPATQLMEEKMKRMILKEQTSRIFIEGLQEFKIENLEKELQNVKNKISEIPIVNKEAIREIVREELAKQPKNTWIDAETAKIVLDGTNELSNKLIATNLFKEGYIDRYEFYKIAGFENSAAPKMPS